MNRRGLYSVRVHKVWSGIFIFIAKFCTVVNFFVGKIVYSVTRFLFFGKKLFKKKKQFWVRLATFLFLATISML